MCFLRPVNRRLRSGEMGEKSPGGNRPSFGPSAVLGNMEEVIVNLGYISIEREFVDDTESN